MIKTNIFKVVSVSLLVLFSVNILIHSIVLVNFKLNQEYIALTLCEEKEIEESTCNGNCQLMKSMEKIEKSSPTSEDNKFTTESHITILFPLEIFEINFPSIILKNEFFSQISKSIPNGFEKVPFRPPIS